MDFRRVSFVGSFFSLEQLPPPSLPEIAFVGRSNVGKSSLINCLVLRRGLVKTSAQPGKTRCLNYFNIDDALYFVDLPGYGFARVSKSMLAQWRQLIESYLMERDALKLVVLLVDVRHEAKEPDLHLAIWLRERQIPYLLVYTKVDKLSANVRQKQVALLDRAFSPAPGARILFSSRTAEGRDVLVDLIGARALRSSAALPLAAS